MVFMSSAGSWKVEWVDGNPEQRQLLKLYCHGTKVKLTSAYTYRLGFAVASATSFRY
jgi:hypothetical protein